MGDYRISLFINCCMLENTTMRIPENFTCITSSQSLVSYKCSQPHSQGSGNEVDMPSKRQAAKLTTLFRSCSVLILRNLTNTWKTRYSVIRAGLTGQDGEEKTNSWEAGLYYILEPLRMRQVDVISQDFATYSRRFLTENYSICIFPRNEGSIRGNVTFCLNYQRLT